MRSIFDRIHRGIRFLRHYGLHEFVLRYREKREPDHLPYTEFVRQNAITEEELEYQRQECRGWQLAPHFVCLVSEEYEPTARENLEEQTYPNWGICAGEWQQEMSVYFGRDDSIYFFALEDGDTLEPSALYFAAKAILFPNECRQSGLHWETYDGSPDLLYTDEDEREADGTLRNPQMKPDFSPDMLEEVCYIRHLMVVSAGVAKQALESMTGQQRMMHIDEGEWIDKYARTCAGEAKYIFHIPRVLYHKAVQGESRYLSEKDDEYSQKVISLNQGCCHILNQVSRPLVSIIIPNKDEKKTLETCIRSVLASTYENYEIIIVENNSINEEIFSYYEELKQNSRIRVITWKGDGTFNYSAINNFGVSESRGEYLVFLNNDVEVITQNWMERMLADCCRREVGAVGVKLYYPNDTVQHAGVVIGIGGHARGIASNMMLGLPRAEDGYMNRASICQNLSAVTAACMMTRRDVFEEVGRFDERLAVAYNDVDLCLKIRKAGYLIVYNPYVEGYHHEYKSRGIVDTSVKADRFKTEIQYMRTKWSDILKMGDPYYNPNLTEYRTDYSLRARQ